MNTIITPSSSYIESGRPRNMKIHSVLHTQFPQKQSYPPFFLPKQPQQDDSPARIKDNNTITPPRLNWLQTALSSALDAAERELVKFETRLPLPKTSDPAVQIGGNFAPVPEHPPTGHSLIVRGNIPSSINGIYLRNGGNPHFSPTAGHHLFDGDGMIHSVSFSGTSNTASYSCRFTQTNRFVSENALGKPVFPKAIGELHGHTGIARLLLFYSRGLIGLLNPGLGIGVANAGLVYFNKRLLAMSEDDLPYHVRITPSGDLRTVGRFDFSGQLASSMIAHPKIDPVSGKLFTLSYDVAKKPHLKYFNFSPDGTKSTQLPIHVESPTMIHDFAITENLVVIPDQQVVFRIADMINNGSPVVYDNTKTSRFGFLNKKATSGDDIIWIDSPDTFFFHLWNAWEEDSGNQVVVIGSCMTPPDSIFNESSGRLQSLLTEIRFDLREGTSVKRQVIKEELNLEAGMVNKNMVGRKSRYVYLGIAEPWPRVSGFAKVDLENGEVEKYYYGGNKFGGEPYFLPTGSSDEGHVMSFVHDEESGESELVVVNAESMVMEASVMLPSRVPYGFHATFVHTEDLMGQM